MSTTTQTQSIKTALPDEIFRDVTEPTPSTVTKKRWDLSPPEAPQPPEPRPKSIYEREPLEDRITARRTGELERRNAQEREEEGEKTSTWQGTVLVMLILVPVVVWIFLILIKPSFVVDTNSDGTVTLRQDKVVLWTLIISVIVWVIIYGLNRCRVYLR